MQTFGTGGSSNVAVVGPSGRRLFPQYPEHGRPHLKAPMLAEVLRNIGYETATIGKWHIHSGRKASTSAAPISAGWRRAWKRGNLTVHDRYARPVRSE